jgi:hypothetical protein
LTGGGGGAGLWGLPRELGSFQVTWVMVLRIWWVMTHRGWAFVCVGFLGWVERVEGVGLEW